MEGVRVEEPAAGEPKENGMARTTETAVSKDQTEHEARVAADITYSAGG